MSKRDKDIGNPVYPALGAGVQKYRRMAASAGGAMAMDRTLRHEYATAAENAIRSLQRQELARVVSLPSPCCASGTYHNDGASISAVVRGQQAARFASAAARDRNKKPEVWAEQYKQAMIETRKARATQ